MRDGLLRSSGVAMLTGAAASDTSVCHILLQKKEEIPTLVGEQNFLHGVGVS